MAIKIFKLQFIQCKKISHFNLKQSIKYFKDVNIIAITLVQEITFVDILIYN